VSATPAIRAFGTTVTPDTTATRSMAVAESSRGQGKKRLASTALWVIDDFVVISSTDKKFIA